MKKLMMMVAVALVGTAAMADYGYLYWAVDQTEAARPIDFVYAQISAPDAGWQSGWLVAQGGMSSSAGPVNTLLESDLSGYQFVVQLLDASYGVVGVSDEIAYADLSAHIFTGLEERGATPYVATTFAVPEPTSGLLFLLGLASLALRRKV